MNPVNSYFTTGASLGSDERPAYIVDPVWP